MSKNTSTVYQPPKRKSGPIKIEDLTKWLEELSAALGDAHMICSDKNVDSVLYDAASLLEDLVIIIENHGVAGVMGKVSEE